MRLDGRMGYGNGRRRHGPLLRDRGLLGLSEGLSVVENACNRRQRMIGRVALIQDLKPPGIALAGEQGELGHQRRVPFLAPE